MNGTSDKGAVKGQGTLGTFAGVFTPSILTILGIILFMRHGYVVGSVGLGRALLIIVMANAISVLTSISLSAIATNLEVKGGGDYFLISRTLGVAFGGAIGIVLFLAQSVSIAFYAIGFGEALAAILGVEVAHAAQLFAGGAVAVLFVLAWLGADWATRFQFGIMAILFAALVAFFLGSGSSWSSELLRDGWFASGELPFWAAFALFFPAVTGFTQGVSLSGDLKDAGRSLPLGTFLAVGVSFAVYIAVAVSFAASVPGAELVGDLRAMRSISAAPWLIDAGVIAATLSSALASFLGAPRILQSLAKDRLFRVLDPFAKGAGPTDNPRRGTLLSLAIALACVGIGRLDLIAPIVAMFFLISYGLLNYATYYEARANSPSFRPRFRFFDARASLLGCVACGAAIVAIDIVAGVVAFALLFAIHQMIGRRVERERWADSSWSNSFQQVRKGLLQMAGELVSPRDWRPVILAFSDDPTRRERLVRFASWIEGGSGLTTSVQVRRGEDREARAAAREAEAELRRELAEVDPGTFPLVVTSAYPGAAFSTLIQAHGIGPVRVNTVLLNWYDQERVAVRAPGLRAYGRYLRAALRFGRNVVVLDADPEDLERLAAAPPDERRIDVWWRDDATGRLMLLLAYLATRHEDWKRARLRVIAARGERDAEELLGELQAFLDEVRIEATPTIVERFDRDEIVRTSRDATLALLPFRVRDDEPVDVDGERLDTLLDELPLTALVLAAEDIVLDSEPDEGVHAELAAAADAAEAAAGKADAAEADAVAATAVVEERRAALEEATAEDRADLERALAEAEESTEQSRRRAVKARAKSDAATRESDELSAGAGVIAKTPVEDPPPAEGAPDEAESSLPPDSPKPSTDA